MMYNRQRKAVLEQNDTKHVRSLQATSSQKEETQKKKAQKSLICLVPRRKYLVARKLILTTKIAVPKRPSKTVRQI
jgi:hypothetical protein